jgi:adenylate kinase family enzyme
LKRVFLTGMSGTGKSTVIDTLAARGYKAVDLDDPLWSKYDANGEWVWREDRVRDLLSAEDADILFVSGCAENQVSFHPRFDDIILLSAPAGVIIERLMSRTNNPYGKDPVERAEVLGYLGDRRTIAETGSRARDRYQRAVGRGRRDRVADLQGVTRARRQTVGESRVASEHRAGRGRRGFTELAETLAAQAIDSRYDRENVAAGYG